MSESIYQEIVANLAAEEKITAGQMFGKPCLKVNGKAFAAYFKGDMAFKIGREEVAPMLQKFAGSQNWDPSGKGRPMKDWLHVPAEFAEQWQALSKDACSFVEANS